MFHILYDGTVFDQRDYTVLGGDADAISVARESSRESRATDDLDAAAAAVNGRRPTSRSPSLAAGGRTGGRSAGSRDLAGRCFRRLRPTTGVAASARLTDEAGRPTPSLDVRH